MDAQSTTEIRRTAQRDDFTEQITREKRHAISSMGTTTRSRHTSERISVVLRASHHYKHLTINLANKHRVDHLQRRKYQVFSMKDKMIQPWHFCFLSESCNQKLNGFLSVRHQTHHAHSTTRGSECFFFVSPPLFKQTATWATHHVYHLQRSHHAPWRNIATSQAIA